MPSASRHFTVSAADVVPPVATLRVSAAWGLPGLLQELGVDLGTLLAEVSLPVDLFNNRENLITYLKLERLLLACEHRSGCDYFGMLLGQRARLQDMGLAGEAALCQPTGGAGLRSFIDHFNLHDTAATVALVEHGAFAHFMYAISEHGLIGTRHFQLASVTIAFNILQDLFGPDWHPAEVRFASRSPSNLRPFQKYFRVPIQFDADESAVIFSRRWMKRPLPAVDPRLRNEVEQAVRKQRAEMMSDFPATVRRVLRKQLLVGDFSMSVVASRLSTNRRTLDRHLQRHRTTFHELLESVRDDVARQLLHDTKMEMRQIAESVRYSSAASFATAFRRRTGMTPSEYRRRVS